METKSVADQIKEKGITFSQIETEIRRLAAEKPDFIYKVPEGRGSCVYLPDDKQAGCIFGQAFIALGIVVPTHENSVGIGTLFAESGLFTPDQILWLSRVQGAQDVTIPWGQAVKDADERKPAPYEAAADETGI
jgi:hypothetical protein